MGGGGDRDCRVCVQAIRRLTDGSACLTAMNEPYQAQDMSETPTFNDSDEAYSRKCTLKRRSSNDCYKNPILIRDDDSLKEFDVFCSGD